MWRFCGSLLRAASSSVSSAGRGATVNPRRWDPPPSVLRGLASLPEAARSEEEQNSEETAAEARRLIDAERGLGNGDDIPFEAGVAIEETAAEARRLIDAERGLGNGDDIPFEAGVAIPASCERFSFDSDKARPRKFTACVRRAAWDAAPTVLGRDKSRWRFDACGNCVMQRLRGFPGVFGYEFDHIYPFSEGGLSDLANCQILQFGVNRAKGNKVIFDMENMELASPYRKYTSEEMDLIEEACYGSVNREGRSCRVMTMGEFLGYREPKNGCTCCGKDGADFIVRLKRGGGGSKD